MKTKEEILKNKGYRVGWTGEIIYRKSDVLKAMEEYASPPVPSADPQEMAKAHADKIGNVISEIDGTVEFVNTFKWGIAYDAFLAGRSSKQEDAVAFAEWACSNGYRYIKRMNHWVIGLGVVRKCTTAELYSLFQKHLNNKK